MIHESVVSAIGATPVVRLSRLFDPTELDVLAKLEYLNPFGSSKDRVARFAVERGLRDRLVEPGGEVVESSSGNFGIALAAVGAHYGLRVTCVVDPTISRPNLTILRGLGAEVELVDEPDAHGGYLVTRLRRVRELCADRPDAWWVNQYANELCWQAHAAGTATELAEQVPGPVDLLVVAVSTTATLAGTMRGLRQRWPDLRAVAVDAEGSVVFGGLARPRRLPGLGSSLPSQLIIPTEVDEVVRVPAEEAVAGCRDLLRAEGILAGASSGAVVGALRRLRPGLAAGTRVLTLLPDRGERYLDLVFTDDQQPAGRTALQHI